MFKEWFMERVKAGFYSGPIQNTSKDALAVIWNLTKFKAHLQRHVSWTVPLQTMSYACTAWEKFSRPRGSSLMTCRAACDSSSNCFMSFSRNKEAGAGFFQLNLGADLLKKNVVCQKRIPKKIKQFKKQNIFVQKSSKKCPKNWPWNAQNFMSNVTVTVRSFLASRQEVKRLSEILPRPFCRDDKRKICWPFRQPAIFFFDDLSVTLAFDPNSTLKILSISESKTAVLASTSVCRVCTWVDAYIDKIKSIEIRRDQTRWN